MRLSPDNDFSVPKKVTPESEVNNIASSWFNMLTAGPSGHLFAMQTKGKLLTQPALKCIIKII